MIRHRHQGAEVLVPETAQDRALLDFMAAVGVLDAHTSLGSTFPDTPDGRRARRRGEAWHLHVRRRLRGFRTLERAFAWVRGQGVSAMARMGLER